MTLEEIVQLAEQGNVNAMLALGDYYFKFKSETPDIDNAYAWYEKAAAAGNLTGMYRAMSCAFIIDVPIKS